MKKGDMVKITGVGSVLPDVRKDFKHMISHVFTIDEVLHHSNKSFLFIVTNKFHAKIKVWISKKDLESLENETI